MTDGTPDNFVPAPEPIIEPAAFYDIFEGTRSKDGQTTRLAQPFTKADD